MTAPLADLDLTLARLSEALTDFTEDWWLIGSAALAVHGAEIANVADVDVLTTPAGVAHLAGRWGCPPLAPGLSERFRSDVFLRWVEAPLPVEVMAGFHVKAGGDWRQVWPRSRVAVAWRGQNYYTPSQAELLQLLDLFERPKDRERAALLRALRSAS